MSCRLGRTNHAAQIARAVVDDRDHSARQPGELEGAFGRGDRLGIQARVHRDGHAKSPAKGLEDGLALVMRILAFEVVDVDRDHGVIDKALEELVNEIEVELAHHGSLPDTIEEQAGPAREVDHHSRERLIEWHEEVTVTNDALLGANGFGKCLAQRNAKVFHGVVGIDLKVALCSHHEVHQAMPSNLIEHVIQERNARIQLALAGAIEVHADKDLGFRSIALDFSDSHRPNDTFAR